MSEWSIDMPEEDDDLNGFVEITTEPQTQEQKTIEKVKKWFAKGFDDVASRYMSGNSYKALYDIFDVFKENTTDIKPIEMALGSLFLYALDLQLVDEEFLKQFDVSATWRVVKFTPVDICVLYEVLRYTIGIYGVIGLTPKNLVDNVTLTKNEFTLNVFLSFTHTNKEDVVEYNTSGNLYDPSYLLAVRHDMHAIMLVYRGTACVSDCATDLVAQPAQVTLFNKVGYCHDGIYHAGYRKFLQIESRLVSLVKMFPDYSIKVMGHSLGGGVAIVVSSLLKSEHPTWEINCYSFAPAGVFSREIAGCPEMKKLVISFVGENDIVPRLSIGSFQSYKRMVQEVYKKIGIKTTDVILGTVKKVENPRLVILKMIGDKKDELIAELAHIVPEQPPFIPSGKVYQLIEKPQEKYDKSGNNEFDDWKWIDLDKRDEAVVCVEVPNECYARIIPRMSMTIDHIPQAYQSIMGDYLEKVGRLKEIFPIKEKQEEQSNI
ncbi:lipase containing protein, putative [Entamoeba invadens IP1]|uniref:lipase containing protein, putative n=1 Tax=Entamoeba invadens IP1 TaxID=370355 RepID=UPI0002C3F734|nr:lipase containing protein, putative [Entamoeba invadens IP1]ELP90483.1 lipase containing protein, putative [Entamoeba invadens IP1]|eukprot:XP_004257254.1 lipase containing protein, putative [Entamoeba invadens IP1]